MVCHETYKDENNNWLSPEDVEYDGSKFRKKGDLEKPGKNYPKEYPSE